MGAWVMSVSAFLAVSSLASQSLGFSLDYLGFDIAYIAKAVRQRDTGTGHPLDQRAAEAFVDHLLEVFDTNNDGQVALAEVRNRLDQYFEERNAEDPESEEALASFRYGFSGPILTLARLLDADESGKIDRNEMEEASNTLVRETGSPVIVAIIIAENDDLLRRQGANEGYITISDDAIAKITSVLDNNNDGAISNEELALLEDTRRFRRRYDVMAGLANRADEDGNNSLNGAEIGEWLLFLNERYSYCVRLLLKFGTVVDRFGRDIGIQWLTTEF